MSDFDTLLRDTLTGLADRAPDETAVRAALDRRRRPRFALVAVAAAVLLVAVAIPLLRVGGPTGAVPPARFAEAPPREAVFTLTPTWLPPGLTERARTASADGTTLTRFWHTGPLAPNTNAALSLWVQTDGNQVGGGEPVDLGELGAGRYFDESGYRTVLWRMADKTVQVSAPFRLADRDTLVRVARGVRVGPPSAARSVLEFGPLPGHEGALTFGVGQAPGGGQVHHVIAEGAVVDGARLIATLTPVDPVVGEPDQRTTVRGHPAEVLTHRPLDFERPTETLAVDLGGRWLVLENYALSPDLSRLPELVRIAEDVRIAPDADNPWLGTH